jgi:hypothetical protein
MKSIVLLPFIALTSIAFAQEPSVSTPPVKPPIAADAAPAHKELFDKLSGSVWQYSWRGGVFEFGFGPAGDLLILPTWHDCHWRVTGPDEVTFEGRHGGIMVLKFDQSVRRFKCKDWDGSSASGTRTARKLPK